VVVGLFAILPFDVAGFDILADFFDTACANHVEVNAPALVLRVNLYFLARLFLAFARNAHLCMSTLWARHL